MKALKKILRIFGLRITRSSGRPAQNVSSRRAFGQFGSSRGEVFGLLVGYRKSIWGADWNAMTQERSTASPEVIRNLQLVEKGRNQVGVLEAFLGMHGSGLRDQEILEIGCFDGAACYALAERGARRVVGIDQACGFVPVPDPTPAQVSEYADWLDSLRHEVGSEFSLRNRALERNVVSFRDVDVCDLADLSSFDLILSSATLEHILNFHRAFARVFAVLKPGGLSLHQYHPFFCSSGAHFDTLDFPWGHVRLSSEDFRRCVSEVKPDEKDISEYRLFRTVNRMTIAEMEEAASSAGFEMQDMVVSGEDWRMLDPGILQQGKLHYPALRLQDLVATNVIVLLRKPNEAPTIHTW